MKTQEKNEFELSDYKFKIVKMEFLHPYVEKSTKGWFYFLIDDCNFIHDYKIQFDNLKITNLTTESHWSSTKRYSLVFAVRTKILNYLGFENKPNKNRKPKPYTPIDNKEVINNLNNMIYNDISWKDITISYVEYIITGSNSSGQGNGKGTFMTKCNNSLFPYGFFTKVLNISEKIKKKYKNVNYKSIWGESINDLYESKDIKIIDFNDWLSINTNLWKAFNLFKSDSHNWKDLTKQFSEQFQKEWHKYNKLDKLIQKYRREQIQNFKKTINADDLCDSINEYFNDNQELTESIEIAHIYPVWKIKEEYEKNEDESILKMIADINNCLPLSKNIHRLYDNKYFYWDYSTGQLESLKPSKDKAIENYRQINPTKLKFLSKYLKNYQKNIIKKI